MTPDQLDSLDRDFDWLANRHRPWWARLFFWLTRIDNHVAAAVRGDDWWAEY